MLTCEQAREATSALLDGEDPAVHPAELSGHLTACRACRRWRAAAHEVTRRARVASAPQVPDRTDDIVTSVTSSGGGQPSRNHWWWRGGLALVAAAQFAATVPVLLFGHDHVAPMHVTHELGSFDLALAVGFLIAAVRPARARIPPAAALRRYGGRAAAVLLLAGAGSIVAGGVLSRPAAAHAMLESTSPASGAVLRGAPRGVSLRFGEQVTVRADAIRVYDDRLHRVDRGAAGHPGGRGDTVGVGLRPGLRPGTYTVTWRVISADSHPVSGGFTFSVGHPSAVAGTARGESGGSATVGMLLGVTRFAGFVGIALGLGSATVLFALWPVGRRVRRARVLVWTGWSLLVIGAAGGLLLQGPYGAGAGLGRLFDPGLFSTTVSTRFGMASMVRITLLLMFAALLGLAFSRRPPATGRSSVRAARPAVRPPAWVLGAGLCVTVGVLVTFALSGHADDDALSALTVTSDVAHLAAIGFWIGGLALLVDCLATRSRALDLSIVLPRFSRLAMVAVAVIAATGSYQSWREVGSWPALVDTVYGRLLLAKIAGFVVLIALGNLARRWVHRHYATARPTGLFAPRTVAHADGLHSTAPTVTGRRPVRHGEATRVPLAALRRGLVGEVVIGVAVLVVTTILVNTAQAKETYAPRYGSTVVADQTRLQVMVDPAHTGTTTIRLHVDAPSGHPLPLLQVSGSLSLPAHHVGPVPVRFTRGAAGRARAVTTFPLAGRWDLDVSVQTSTFDATAFRVAIPVHYDRSASEGRPVVILHRPARTVARLGLLAATVATVVLIGAVPAFAHVTVHADTAAPGAGAKITFRVPTEADNASTTALRVSLPRTTPIASVAVQPHPGWSFHVTTARLAKPIQTDDGPVTTAVTEITWRARSAASAIKPGEFDEFSLSADPLPKAAVLRFPALQTYSNGQVVRWIQVAAPGAPEPEHPAPTLTLTAVGAGSPGGAAQTPAHVTSSAPASSGSAAALALAITALVIALLGLASGVLALRRGRILR